MVDVLNVLIVEDIEDDALLVVRELHRGDFSVEWERVQTSETIHQALNKRTWDVIISDYHLPEITAPEVFEILQQRQLNLPFIVISGKINESLSIELMRQGASDYLQKDHLKRLPEAVRRSIKDAKILEERQQQALELARTKESLQLAIAGSGIGLWDWAVQTGSVTFNDRWAEIIGYSIEELEPLNVETWRQNTHPDDLQKATLALEQHFRKETETYECELRMRHKLGGWVWVLASGKVVEWDTDGKPLRMAGTHLDISGRKQSVEMLINRQFKDEMQRVLMKQRILRKEYDSQVIFWVCD